MVRPFQLLVAAATLVATVRSFLPPARLSGVAISTRCDASAAPLGPMVPPYTRTRGVVSLSAAPGDTKAVQKDAEAKMKKSIESVETNFKGIRTGRATPNMLDRVMVDYYGTATPLNQLAGITVASSQSLVVTPYDKGAFKPIEVAILESGLGLNPNNEGSLLRLNIPPLTEERRKELTKTAKGLGEDGKVAIRNIRREAVEKVKKMEKDKVISKDESANVQEAIQKLTDKYTKNVEESLKAKEKEIMTV